MLSEELCQRVAKEYRYAATKMRESAEIHRKLYYCSAFYGEAQRVLNFQWDTDLAQVYMATHYVYSNIRSIMQNPASAIPFDAEHIFSALIDTASGIADYFEDGCKDSTKLHDLIGMLAKIGYVTTGNGGYLYERGEITL